MFNFSKSLRYRIILLKLAGLGQWSFWMPAIRNIATQLLLVNNASIADISHGSLIEVNPLPEQRRLVLLIGYNKTSFNYP
jgi:hypothetical protein